MTCVAAPTQQATSAAAAHWQSSLGSVPTPEGSLPTGGRLGSVVKFSLLYRLNIKSHDCIHEKSLMNEYGKGQIECPLHLFYLMSYSIPLQPNSALTTWFMKRAVHLAWTHAHTWTQVLCVRSIKWTVASVLLVRVIPFYIRHDWYS